MKFENLKGYFEEKGYKVLYEGNAPHRRIIVSKQNFDGEYHEDYWSKLSHEEQLKELEEMIWWSSFRGKLPNNSNKWLRI